MSKDTAAPEVSVGTWQKEFFQNMGIFTRAGLSEDQAREILKKFLHYCATTPLPRVMETFEDPEKLNEVGVYTEAKPEAREFMLKFFGPILQNIEIHGVDNLELIAPLIGKYPVTIISNHLSHLDAPAIFYVLYNSGPEGRRLAEKLVFIAGRLAYIPEFTRLGLYMFGTLLVCSQKDISEHISQADIMTKINMRSYRTSQALGKEGMIMCVFPEGTRSRNGQLMPFVETSYHYLANKIVLPISLEGTENILPTQRSYLFNAAKGSVHIGNPIVVGNVREGEVPIPESIERLPYPKSGDKKSFIIDNLALYIGKGIHQHRHGAYRNLYKGDILEPDNNQLITVSNQPTEKIVVMGHSQMGTAVATALANKYVDITVYIKDEPDLVEDYNKNARDLEYYPLFKLPPNLTFSSDSSVLERATIFIQAESPWQMDDMLADHVEVLKNSKAPIINVAKGLSSSRTGLVLSDLQTNYGIPKERLITLGGAVIPYQLMERKFTAQEAAAYDENLLDAVLPIFNTGYLSTRKALNPTDVIGVQLGSALKTMYALGIGLFEGYFTEQMGGNADNTTFALAHRAFVESKKVGVHLGAQESTFDGLSGISDFMLSCFGDFNQDRIYGAEFAKGNKDPKPTHGLYSLRVLPQILDISGESFPILKGIYSIVVRGQDVEEKILELQRMFRKA